MDVGSTDFKVISRKDTHLVGKTVYLKTPITCTHPKADEGYICRGCYSELLSMVNYELHIGKVTAFDTSNEFQQILLSAKHANTTSTKLIGFNQDFYNFFRLDYDQIVFNDSVQEAIFEKDSTIEDYVFEFMVYGVAKNKSGEGHKRDRAVKEISIVDKKHDTRYVISEENDGNLYMVPKLSEMYRKAFNNSMEDIIEIPFLDFADFEDSESIFEVDFKNKELAEALIKIKKIISTKAIKDYDTYDEVLDTLIPYFIKGGLKIQDIHLELIISRLICNSDGKNLGIDWHEESPKYEFQRVESAILNKDSVIPSIMYSHAIDQLQGKYGTYDKKKPSAYDVFLADM